MIFTLHDSGGLITRLLPPKGQKTMNRLRCLLFAAIVLIFSATFVLGGDIQGPGKSAVTPTPTPIVLTTASTRDGLTQAPATEETQIVWQDATMMLVQLLLTIY
jgi:hypothetical protein